MLALDQKVTLSCTETGQDAAGTIVRIQGSRVDVALSQGGGELLVSLHMQKAGLYVGSKSGLEFVMRI
jgi:glycine cleavage system H lipoate-binding protein